MPSKLESAMHQPWTKWVSLPIAVLVLLGFVRLTTQQTDRDNGADADGRHYVSMAGDTAMFGKSFARIAPFCYRIATPWMAKQLPGETVIAKFGVLALLDTTLILLLFYALLVALGFSHWDSILGMVLYGTVFWTVKFAFLSPCYIDHSMQVVTLLVLVTMAKGWWPLLPILVFGGYFQKESVVALVPVILIYYLQIKGWRWWPLYVLGFFLLAAAIIPRLILKNNVHPINLNNGSPLHAITESWNIIATTPGYPRILLVAIFSGMGLLPLVIISHFRFCWTYLRQHLHWIAMIMIGTFLLLGGKDKSRLFLQMLPAVTVVAVAAIRDLRTQMPRWKHTFWLAITLLLHLFMGNLLTPFRDFLDYINRMVPEHSPTEGGQGFTRMLLVSTLFAIANYWLRHRHSSGDSRSHQAQP